MDNTIEACKQAQANLVFFDNVQMYGKVTGAMTEETPYAPCAKKGEIRAKIATTLMRSEIGFAGTPYLEGIRIAAASYKRTA